jgi:D-alanyl-D-alanine carboxypeptidase
MRTVHEGMTPAVPRTGSVRRSFALLFAALGSLLLAASCSGGDDRTIDVGLPTKPMSAADSAFIDKVARDMLEGRLFFSEGELPGVWIGIWDPVKGVHVRAYGKADVAAGRDADPDDFVRIADITKTFVATIVLQLADEGKLRLSDTVERHLPELVKRFPGLRDRTVRQLLSMRSGVPDFYEAWRDELSRQPNRTFEPERVVELGLRKPVTNAGTFEYSETNYVLLGQIAEAVTGTPLDELIAKRVTKPLGIPDARLLPNDDTSLPGPAAHGYAFECAKELDAIGAAEGDDLTDRSVSGYLGAGGMVARFSDLGVWGASALGNALLPKALRRNGFAADR